MINMQKLNEIKMGGNVLQFKSFWLKEIRGQSCENNQRSQSYIKWRSDLTRFVLKFLIKGEQMSKLWKQSMKSVIYKVEV